MRWFSVEEAMPMPMIPVLIWDQWDAPPDIAVIHIKHPQGPTWVARHCCTYIEGVGYEVMQFTCPDKIMWAHMSENPWESQEAE